MSILFLRHLSHPGRKKEKSGKPTQTEESAEQLQHPRPEGERDGPDRVRTGVGERHDGVDRSGADGGLRAGPQHGVDEPGGQGGVQAVLEKGEGEGRGKNVRISMWEKCYMLVKTETKNKMWESSCCAITNKSKGVPTFQKKSPLREARGK